LKNKSEIIVICRQNGAGKYEFSEILENGIKPGELTIIMAGKGRLDGKD
jgi:ABC-type branched-subunit amino acid transport system ATPase component